MSDSKILKFWPIVATSFTLIGVLVATVYQISAMRSEVVHAAELGERDRLLLHNMDARLDRRVSDVEKNDVAIGQQLVKISTQQNALAESVGKIDRKLDTINGPRP